MRKVTFENLFTRKYNQDCYIEIVRAFTDFTLILKEKIIKSRKKKEKKNKKKGLRYKNKWSKQLYTIYNALVIVAKFHF